MFHLLLNTRPLLMALPVSLFAADAAIGGLAVENDAKFPEKPDIVGATPAQANDLVRFDVPKKPRSNNRADSVMGQTFTPSKTIKLDKVFIEYAQAVDGEPIQLRIHAVDDDGASTHKAGKNLLSEEAKYTFSADKGDVSEDERVLGLDLTGDDEITLQQGQAYVFEIVSGDDDGVIDFRWSRTGSRSPVKLSGHAYIDRQRVEFKTKTDCDLSFAITAKSE